VAQEVTKFKIDSLKAVIKANEHDTLVINAMFEWQIELNKSNTKKRLKVNEGIIVLCDKKGLEIGITPNEKYFYKEAKAKALYNIGSVYAKDELREKSITSLKQSLEISSKLKDSLSMAHTAVFIARSYRIFGDYEDAHEYAALSLEIYHKIGNKEGMSDALNNMGIVFNLQGNSFEAIKCYRESIEFAKVTGDKIGIASGYNNIALIYDEQANYADAIDNLTTSLSIYEGLGYNDGVANVLNNIGSIYLSQNDYIRAIDYFKRCLALDRAANFKSGIASSLMNLSSVYDALEKNDTSLTMVNEALAIYIELDYKRGKAIALRGIASLKTKLGKNEEALSCFEQSLEISIEMGDKQGISMSLLKIGSLFSNLKNYGKAISYASRGLKIAQEIGEVKQVKESSKILFEVYKKQGESRKALEMYELYVESKDSMERSSNHEEVVRQEFKYKYDKQTATDSIKSAQEEEINNAQLLAQKAINTKQKQRSYFLYAGLVLALLFGAYVFNRFRVSQRQKHLIEKQKSEVEEAHKEIQDSIAYAKRIQSAILPSAKLVKECLKESFILYKPKDVVAGDFYWMESVAPTGNNKDTKVLFAAADCTGHGVPGAMVSLVCNNALNRSVREHGLSDPGEILTKTRDIVIQEFEKSEEDVNDGMDIALCSLEGNKLQYAGAHNPLWIIRNGEIIETKANKQPIGQFDNPKPYKTHSFDLETGDSLYIFSDGYVDQFGGEKGKKFKTNAFRKLLLSIQDKAMEEQKTIIDEAFETWRRDLEQIDDVCVIGVRV
jgi:serine phosphatase RsbU (regulator of sigma subunit)